MCLSGTVKLVITHERVIFSTASYMYLPCNCICRYRIGSWFDSSIISCLVHCTCFPHPCWRARRLNCLRKQEFICILPGAVIFRFLYKVDTISFSICGSYRCHDYNAHKICSICCGDRATAETRHEVMSKTAPQWINYQSHGIKWRTAQCSCVTPTLPISANLGANL